MRETRRLVDTDTQPWEALNEVLQRKVLNGDPDTGPHTLLLKSDPRDPGPAFAQYHPIDEELFGLDGDFTFDGSTWFGRGSYAFYPAYFVHGAQVHVRGGYLVYLRQTGPGELFTVDDPDSTIPYYVGDGESSRQALQFADAATQGTSQRLDDGDMQIVTLDQDAETGKGSALIRNLAASAGRTLELESAGLLEVFTLSGGVRIGDSDRLSAHTYHCEVGGRVQLSLYCEAQSALIVSHDGALQLR